MTVVSNETSHQRTNPGFANLVFVITLLLIFLMASRTPMDSDLWWHLRAGQVMVETGKPLLTDIFSLTRGGETWVNHSWLSEIILFEIYRLGGWTGLSAWMGLMAVLIGIVLWKIIPSGSFTRAGFVILASIACAPLWTPRPQFFSLVLLAALVWIVEGWKNNGGKLIWLVLPLFILWSNLHGGYMLGVLFLLASAAGQFLDCFLIIDNKKKLVKQVGVFAGLALGGYLLAAVNPNGIRMLFIPFDTVGVGVLRQLIQEWSSPDFHSIEIWPFAIWLVLTLVSLARKKESSPFFHLIPAVLFILLALYARRNIAAAVLVSMIMLVGSWRDAWTGFQIEKILPGWAQKILEQYQSNRGQQFSEVVSKIINLTLAGLLGIVCMIKLVSVSHPVLVESFEARYYPKSAVVFMKANPTLMEGHLFNAYNWGGYLEWKDPSVKVFVDGRTDLFGDAILNEWISVMQAKSDWEEILEKWNITRVIIEPDRPLINSAISQGWVERYRDDQSVILDKAPE